LPWFWHGFDMFWFAALMVVLVPGALAFVFGWLAFRSRVTGVYLSIITQALTYALMLAFFRNEMGFGGNNGLTDFKDILGFDLQADSTRIGTVRSPRRWRWPGLLACRWIVTSKLGKVLVAVRDAEPRTRASSATGRTLQALCLDLLGDAGRHRRCAVCAAGRHHQPRRVLAAQLHRVVIWVAVGGRATLVGAILGGSRCELREDLFTGAFPDIWLFALGGLFVLVTLFLPKGIVGTVSQGWTALKQRKVSASAESGSGTPPTAPPQSPAAPANIAGPGKGKPLSSEPQPAE
jgi:urea transport system permease protein